MSTPGQLSERAIILAPRGRDSQIALRILQEAGFPALITHDLAGMCRELISGAGLAIIADEAGSCNHGKPLAHACLTAK